MIVSVHLPKTAGTSFAGTLRRHFNNGFLRDYSDIPINTPPYPRNKYAMEQSVRNLGIDFSKIKCIHGHFLPVKYLLLSIRKEISFVTWMRNPVERLLSHYNYWLSRGDLETAAPLHRKMIEEKWTLERFCFGPEVRNLYGQFLYAFPLEYFAFIGITEYYEEDLRSFEEMFLCDITKAEWLNSGDKTNNPYDISESFRRDIEAWHSEDVKLYNRALNMRLERRLI